MLQYMQQHNMRQSAYNPCRVKPFIFHGSSFTPPNCDRCWAPRAFASESKRWSSKSPKPRYLVIRWTRNSWVWQCLEMLGFQTVLGDREPARAMMMLFLGEFPCMQVTWEWGCWDEVVEVVEMSKKWAVWRPNAWCYLSYVTRHVVYYSSYWSATRSTMLF